MTIPSPLPRSIWLQRYSTFGVIAEQLLRSRTGRGHRADGASVAGLVVNMKDSRIAENTVSPVADRRGSEPVKSTVKRVSTLARALGTVAMLATTGVAAAADTNLPQDQALKELIEKQEQRIRNLEKRLEEMESAAMSGKDKKEPAAAQAVVPVPASQESAAAQAVAEATASIDLSPGEFREPHKILTGLGLASEAFPGSWPLFGTDLRMKIGGYFKADAIYDFGGNRDKTQFLMADIPVEGTAADNRGEYFNMTARETRFSFDIRRTPPGGPAQKFFLEMDFFGGDNAVNSRMRHAYLQYGNLIVGQTWSTVTDLRLLPFMIDFAYGDAIFGARTKQVRWQQQANKNWSWAVGLENIDYSGIDSQGLSGAASPQLPLIGGRLTYEDSSTVLLFGGEIKPLRWDGEQSGPDATATGWDIVHGGRKNLGRRDYVTWNMSYGDGTADNLVALTGRNYSATLFADGRLETNRHWNVSLGYTHNFTNFLSTNFNYAVMDTDSDYPRPADSLKSAWIAHANLIWKLSPAMLTGIEYMWGEAENVSGATGDSSRAQATVMYTF